MSTPQEENPYAPPPIDAWSHGRWVSVWPDVFLMVGLTIASLVAVIVMAISLYGAIVLASGSYAWAIALPGTWTLGVFSPGIFQALRMLFSRRRT